MAVFARFPRYIRTRRNVLSEITGGKTYHSRVPEKIYNDKIIDDNTPDYQYEVTFNAEEWKHVDRLLPLRVVPKISEKAEYPSGWRPQTEEAFKHPYYLARTKNHMLPVYLDKTIHKGFTKTTVIKNIRGDIWKFHEELHKHLEESLNTKVYSQVLEGNCRIQFKGDLVYYCEQWCLSKGF